VERIAWCYGRVTWIHAGRRTWTLEPPAWWRGEITLDEQLDLEDLQATAS
jgi:hypothetical protein